MTVSPLRSALCRPSHLSACPMCDDIFSSTEACRRLNTSEMCRWFRVYSSTLLFLSFTLYPVRRRQGKNRSFFSKHKSKDTPTAFGFLTLCSKSTQTRSKWDGSTLRNQFLGAIQLDLTGQHSPITTTSKLTEGGHRTNQSRLFIATPLFVPRTCSGQLSSLRY